MFSSLANRTTATWLRIIITIGNWQQAQQPLTRQPLTAAANAKKPKTAGQNRGTSVARLASNR
jgi:hypothetical protein